MLEQRTRSHHRDRLSKNAHVVRKRTIKRAVLDDEDGVEQVGYYGSRGSRVMMDWLIETYSARLRALKAKDPLIVAVGVPIFVQDVLRPELAGRLVREDMWARPEMKVGVKERAFERAEEKEREWEERRRTTTTTRKTRKADVQGYAELVSKRRNDDQDGSGVDWAAFAREGDEAEEEQIGRWILEESADLGRLLCVDDGDDELAGGESNDEAGYGD